MQLNAKLMKETLNKVISVVPAKANLPILENVLMKVQDGTLTLMASNLEIFLEARLGVNIDESVEVCLEAKRLKTILDSLGDKFFNFDFTGKTAVLTCGNIRHEFAKESAADFPLPVRLDTYDHSFPVDTFVTENINKVIPFANTDELRRNMAGVYFDNGNIVATDGFRMVVVKSECKIDNLLLPIEVAKLFDKFNSPTVNYTGEELLIESDSLTMYAKAIDDTFPAYKQVIPDTTDNTLTVNRKDFITSLKGVMLSADKITKRVCLSIKDNKLTLTADNPEVQYHSEDIIDVRCSLDEFITSFNGEYLLDILAVLKDETVTFDFTTEKQPFIAKNSLLTTLLMPVRIDIQPVSVPEETQEEAPEVAEENITENYSEEEKVEIIANAVGSEEIPEEIQAEVQDEKPKRRAKKNKKDRVKVAA